jgi:hypothetical protein
MGWRFLFCREFLMSLKGIMDSSQGNTINEPNGHEVEGLVKANCVLIAVRGKHYYTEGFGKFIPIERWEYERILSNPYHYYFSTALKKHLEWRRVERSRSISPSAGNDE